MYQTQNDLTKEFYRDHEQHGTKYKINKDNSYGFFSLERVDGKELPEDLNGIFTDPIYIEQAINRHYNDKKDEIAKEVKAIKERKAAANKED